VRWRQLIEPGRLMPRKDAPLPLWMIFPVIFAALYASHFQLMRVPYYWDEAGYYIPAAWDFFRTGSLIPLTTLTNAHPPLPSIYLALWWRLSGFDLEVTREAVLIVASVGLLAVWRLALRINGSSINGSSAVGSSAVALWTVVLTAAYPIWFAQSTLAHADIFAAACTLWGLVYSLPDRNRRPWVAAVWFSAAALCKETSIAIPLALAMISTVAAVRAMPPVRWRLMREAMAQAACLLPLAAWYVYHFAKTGFIFGNPEFLRYNAQATLDPLRIVAAFGHRLLHLTAHMNLFVPVLCAMGALFFSSQLDAEGHTRSGISRSVQTKIFVLLAADAAVFSVLGGALLTRYLLPMYPLICLLAVSTFYRRVRYWQGVAAFSLAAFGLALFVNPPYGFAPEDNLTYAQVVRQHVLGAAQLQSAAKDGTALTVLTAWPGSDELTRPELGYVQRPLAVYRLEDFSDSEIARAAADGTKYSAALVFSTKYDPPVPIFSLGPFSKKLDERYFGLHHDESPEVIASKLGGIVTWKREEQGMWTAVIRFDRPAAEKGTAAGWQVPRR